MGIYIRTRGSRIDYSFLPQQPEQKNLSDYSDFEKPTCILERLEEGELYLFLSGIPSQRKDHQGTPLRYDLVVTMKSGNWVDDGDNDGNAEKLNGLLNLIWMWLNDVRKALQETQEEGKSSKRVRLPAIAKSELGKRLDTAFPEEYIEELLKLTVERNWTPDQKNKLDSKKKELDDTLKRLISQIRSDPEGQQPDHNYWWGGIDDDDSCNQWIKLVEKLLKGETQGKALLLNIATPKSLGRLSVEENEQLGVLLAKENYRSQPKQIEPIDLPKTNNSTTPHPIVELPKTVRNSITQFLKNPKDTIKKNMGQEEKKKD